MVCKQWRQVALSKPVAETLRLWDRATGAGAVQLEAEGEVLGEGGVGAWRRVGWEGGARGVKEPRNAFH